MVAIGFGVAVGGSQLAFGGRQVAYFAIAGGEGEFWSVVCRCLEGHYAVIVYAQQGGGGVGQAVCLAARAQVFGRYGDGVLRIVADAGDDVDGCFVVRVFRVVRHRDFTFHIPDELVVYPDWVCLHGVDDRLLYVS